MEMNVSKLFRMMLPLTLLALLGCPRKDDEMTPSGDVDDIEKVLTVLNDDLVDEGAAVSREELEAAFRDDPELMSAVIADLGGGLPAMILEMAGLNGPASE
jgi:hypothetical protein